VTPHPEQLLDPLALREVDRRGLLAACFVLLFREQARHGNRNNRHYDQKNRRHRRECQERPAVAVHSFEQKTSRFDVMSHQAHPSALSSSLRKDISCHRTGSIGPPAHQISPVQTAAAWVPSAVQTLTGKCKGGSIRQPGRISWIDGALTLIRGRGF